uniref:ATP synthase complex subunit 8 n=1 Tax=Scaphiopus holbrookii TaxID=8435 RepID=A0A343J6A5_9ANUR|nr:ATP synthase F0 subunit 8 [Scaphiopus holbrookii]ASV64476.1 ATP synthase F0 subunit 8 [Scaphiopus holbrookii]
MPQLNPGPWFAILVFSWLILLVILPPKITKHNLLSNPSPQASKKPQTTYWTWPWT